MFRTELFNVSDFLKIAIMAFIGIILINWILRQAGMSQYQA